MSRAIRWGDNDRYLGPFTWAAGDWKKFAFILRSRGDDDIETGKCSLRISAYSYTLIVALPNIVKPHMEKVYPGTSWDAETVKRLGRDWYWNIDPREYGFSYSDGFLQVFYGRTGGSMMDSRVEQRWGCFLPWTQWRHVRHSFYGLDGELIATAPKTTSYKLDGGRSWEIAREMADATPTITFNFVDYDGQELQAVTKIEEREWRFGTGWFKWLSLFRRPKIGRSLDIRFSDEVGPEKGSWKGGTIGTSIEMLPDERHEQAFRRFCDQEHRAKHRKYGIKFLGVSVAE